LSDNGLESTTINKKLITIDAKREWYEMEYVISPSQPLATGWFQIVADLPAQWFLNAGTRKIRFSPVSYPMLKLFRACWLTNPNKVKQASLRESGTGEVVPLRLHRRPGRPSDYLD
jgi:hypothetical protein